MLLHICTSISSRMYTQCLMSETCFHIVEKITCFECEMSDLVLIEVSTPEWCLKVYKLYVFPDTLSNPAVPVRIIYTVHSLILKHICTHSFFFKQIWYLPNFIDFIVFCHVWTIFCKIIGLVGSLVWLYVPYKLIPFDLSQNVFMYSTFLNF